MFLTAAVPAFTAAAQDSASVAYAGEAFLEQLQPRDSVLIADQLRYGFELEKVESGTGFMFPDYSQGFCEGVEVVSPWRLDTVRVVKGKKKAPELMDIRGSVVITSFDVIERRCSRNATFCQSFHKRGSQSLLFTASDCQYFTRRDTNRTG